MQITHVLESCLYVDDLAAARRFYSEVLGLEDFASVPGRHVFFRCGSGVLLLFDPAQTSRGGGDVPAHGAFGPGHLAFAMAEEEIDLWRSHLWTAGVEIETELQWPNGGYSLYFRDPAGNSIELTTPATWRFSRDR